MTGLLAIGIGMSVLVGAAAGIGTSLATSKAVESAARQPEASGKITTLLALGCAFSEATAVYGFIIAFLMIAKL